MRYKNFLTLSLLLAVALSACDLNPSNDSATSSAPASSPEGEPDSPTMEIPLASATSPVPSSWWHPTVGLTWQWQIGDNDIDTSIQADVYDVDLYVDQSIIDELHAKGRKVICYISVGSWEDWRPDKDQFPSEVLGNDYDGWPGEKWLDIREIQKLAPIMRARLDLCKSKGFDAVEPDNMEIYTNDTGFPLTYEDQLRYALWLADEAHQRGLAIGVKNAPDQVKDLVDHFDFAITEDAFFYDWAEEMNPFIEAGKPVFAAEYTDLGGDFESYCQKSKELKFSIILKNRDLDAWIQTCP
jgi:endo-alpha-1,4-polygalactosaminidase (GH114 family)